MKCHPSHEPSAPAQDPGSASQVKTRLIASAIICFSKRGYGASSLRDIIATAGIDPVIALQRFPSKDELYREVLDFILRHHARPLLSLAATHAEPGPGTRAEAEQAIRAYLDAFLRILAVDGASGPLGQASRRILLQELVHPTSAFHARALHHCRPALAYFERCLGVLRPDLPGPTRAVLAQAMHGLGLHCLREQPGLGAVPAPLGLVETCIDFCLHGACGQATFTQR